MESSVAVRAGQEIEDPLAYLPYSTIVEYPKGHTIYNHNQISNTLYLVIEGRVNVSRLCDNGRQILIDIYQTDDFFGESVFLNVPHRPEHATALDRTKLMSWATPALTDVLIRRPQLAIALLQVVARRTINLKERIESLSVDTIARRLARSLLRFSLRMGTANEDGAVRMPPFTHELLAQYVGTSREIVTCYMNQLRRQGHLQYSRRIMTVYPEALRRFLSREE